MKDVGVKPVLGHWQSSNRRSKRDEVIICCSHIDRMFLRQSLNLAEDNPPQCEHCHCILTVHHILGRCPHLQLIRDDVFGNDDVIELFRFHP